MRIIKSLLVIGLCLALAGPALAQTGGGQGMGRTRHGPRHGTRPRHGHDVQSPDRHHHPGYGGKPRDRKWAAMQHVSWVVKTDQGNITVHLGPARYINQHQIVLKPGDAVEVTGSKMEMGGGTMMVAKEVKVGGKTFQLRDDQGVPLWRGQGRPQPQ